MRNGIFTSPNKVLINLKGEKSNFTAKKPGRHHLHQGIKDNITGIGQIRIMLYLLRCNRNTVSLLRHSSQHACPMSNLGDASNKSKLKEIPQKNWRITFKRIKVMKVRERLTNCL